MTWARINSIAVLSIILFLFAEVALLFLTPRHETTQLLVLYFALCGAYLFLYQEVKSIRSAAFLGVLFRVVAWLAFPLLSQDLYRYIWDGAVILEGVSPYAMAPTDFFRDHVHSPFEQIYPLLGSSQHHTFYPTVIQMVSAFGALASNDFYLASLIIKLPILIAEIATIWMLPKLLLNFKISPKYSVLYMLNPLLIIELVGNAHFEGLMICLVVYSLKLIQERSYTAAGIVLACSIATKLMPLILVPFLWKTFKSKEAVQFMAGLIAALSALFLPLFDATYLRHFIEGLTLYVNTFEFNASVYYVLRTLGDALLGYPPSAMLSPALLLPPVVYAVYKWWKLPRHNVLEALRSSLWVLTAYFIFASAVYPWYISFVVVLGVLTRRHFGVIWSVVIFVSYSSYAIPIVEENPWILGFEYGVLFLAMAYPKFIRQLIVSPINRL